MGVAWDRILQGTWTGLSLERSQEYGRSGYVGERLAEVLRHKYDGSMEASKTRACFSGRIGVRRQIQTRGDEGEVGVWHGGEIFGDESERIIGEDQTCGCFQ